MTRVPPLAILLTCLSLFSGMVEARLGRSTDTAFAPHRLTQNTANGAHVTPRAPAQAADDVGSNNSTQRAMLVIGAGLVLCAAGLLAWRLGQRRKARPGIALPPASVPPAGNWQLPGSNTASIIALAVASGNAPADFPLESFLRKGKATFVHLQQANDRMDLHDIRECTTPEMFAEISLQMHERGDTPRRTDILALHAELLEVSIDGEQSTASVRFTGQLRINKSEHTTVDEVWRVQRDLRDEHANWLVAGIQQVTLH